MLVAAWLAAGPARADFFSSSPGPLSNGHANLDNKDHCLDCHIGSRELSRDKCLACHKPIAERQAQHRGLHGTAKALGRPCELCHTEHRGRGSDIFGWKTFGGLRTFEHSAVGWPLEGRHQQVLCAKCHTAKTSVGSVNYLKAQKDCASCHKNPHGETRDAARQCERCHDAASWRQIEKPQFDHDKDTRYPLQAKHEKVRCLACHATRPEGKPPRAKAPPPQPVGPAHLTFRWRSWATDCVPCHDNAHGEALFGRKRCALCHSAQVVFTSVSFDHNRQTHFRLEGTHADPGKAPCYACHKKDERNKPDQKCVTCHQNVHGPRFEKQNNGDCAVCHTPVKFREIRFDHTAHTRFRLDGAHRGALCSQCHRGDQKKNFEHLETLVEKVPGAQNPKVACMGCHQHANVHKKQYTDDQCLKCHQRGGVREAQAKAADEIHAPDARFPLLDGHKGLKCTQCHPNNTFKGAPLVCGPTCHADQLHKGTLGNECLKCHEGAVWEAKRFDHNKMTKFPLTGHHREARCPQCHAARNFASNRGKEATCASCHAKDDPHRGALGTHCERCHDPEGVLHFDHNDRKFSSFPIEGKHVGVLCQSCHTSVRFLPTPSQCEGCHPEPQVHRGQLGTRCGACHSVKGWKLVGTGHDVPTPRFGGAHDRVPCARCHVGGRLLAGTGRLCVMCHRNDDIHHNTLGPDCGDCHSQRTFAGARFDHNRVGCELTGVHRLLPCVDCHKGGNFTALSPTCISCHFDSVRRATALSMTPAGMAMGVPSHDFFSTCTNCHNPNYFVPAQKTVNFRESVCR